MDRKREEKRGEERAGEAASIRGGGALWGLLKKSEESTHPGNKESRAL